MGIENRKLLVKPYQTLLSRIFQFFLKSSTRCLDFPTQQHLGVLKPFQQNVAQMNTTKLVGVLLNTEDRTQNMFQCGFQDLKSRILQSSMNLLTQVFVILIAIPLPMTGLHVFIPVFWDMSMLGLLQKSEKKLVKSKLATELVLDASLIPVWIVKCVVKARRIIVKKEWWVHLMERKNMEGLLVTKTLPPLEVIQALTLF